MIMFTNKSCNVMGTANCYYCKNINYLFCLHKNSSFLCAYTEQGNSLVDCCKYLCKPSLRHDP